MCSDLLWDLHCLSPSPAVAEAVEGSESEWGEEDEEDEDEDGEDDPWGTGVGTWQRERALADAAAAWGLPASPAQGKGAAAAAAVAGNAGGWGPEGQLGGEEDWRSASFFRGPSQAAERTWRVQGHVWFDAWLSDVEAAGDQGAGNGQAEQERVYDLMAEV